MRPDEEAAGETAMAHDLTIGICQNLQTYDFERNMADALSMVDQAASLGADVVVLPEMFFTPYEPEAIRRAARFSATALDSLKDAAASRRVIIVAGSMPWPSEEKRLFNRAFVIDGSGKVIYHHDKIHLFDCTPPGGPKVVESRTIVPGSSLGLFPTPWGNASVIVCYDIRFTPLAELLSGDDVRILFVPAAFSSATGRAHWEMLVRLRAVELQSFVVGVQPASNPELKYIPWGHSLVASPWGDVLLDAGTDEAVQVVRVDLGEIERVRARFPLLKHHRKDLYTTLWRGGA